MSSEARSLNQATYVPINAGDNESHLSESSPSSRIGMISVVFDSHSLISTLISAMRKSSKEPPMSINYLEASAGAILRGEISVALENLTKFKDDYLISILNSAISLKEYSYQQAALNLDRSIQFAKESLEKNPDSGQSIVETALEVFWTNYKDSAEFMSAVDADFSKPIANLRNESYLLTEQFHNVVTDISREREILQLLARTGRREAVGLLHLERLAFTPLGYERGELVYSLSLTPHEKVFMSYREWTKTDSEYITSVTESIENSTQQSLSEKSELSESVKSQQQHSNGLDASASASGSYGPFFTASASLDYRVSDSITRSEEDSAKRSQDITKSASSRVKKELKVNFKLTTERGTEEQSYKQIENPTDRPVRWDFHRINKKWQIDLYRYGIRLTYDIVIPEPGSYLLRKYALLKVLAEEISKPFTFTILPWEINQGNYLKLAALYGALPDSPPDPTVDIVGHVQKTFSTVSSGTDFLELKLPDNYEFKTWSAEGSIVTRSEIDVQRLARLDPLTVVNTNILESGAKYSSRYAWVYEYNWGGYGIGNDPRQGDTLSLRVLARGSLTNKGLQEWQAKTWERFAQSAKAQHEARIQRLTQLRYSIEEELEVDDPLILRKIEKEEIMKGVLRWMLGPAFSFYPSSLPSLRLGNSSENLGEDIEYYFGDALSLTSLQYNAVLKHGELVRFLQQAIEWENVNYLMYPYFWTDYSRWDLKQNLWHKDFVHRNFLRAGAARVVLTIRPGFERSFLTFARTLNLDGSLPPTHRYMTLAEELESASRTVYPFTRNPNTENLGTKVSTWYEYTPTGALDIAEGAVLE